MYIHIKAKHFIVNTKSHFMALTVLSDRTIHNLKSALSHDIRSWKLPYYFHLQKTSAPLQLYAIFHFEISKAGVHLMP